MSGVDSANGSFYSAMLSAVTNGGARDETSDYIDEYDSDLSNILSESLDISAEEAQSFIDIAQAAAGGKDANIEDVLNEILELLNLDDVSSVSDAEDIDVADLDFSEFIQESFQEMASGEGVLTEDDSDKLAAMLGISEEDAGELIEFTGGEFNQLTKFLFDDNRDGEIAFDELTSDRNVIKENLESSRKVIDDFDNFEHGGFNFSVGEDGNLPEGSIANASVEEGKAGMAAFLSEKLGFAEGEADDAIDKLIEEGLLSVDANEDGKIGALALVQFKTIISEYAMKADDLEDASGDEKIDALTTSAEDAKASVEEQLGNNWDDPAAAEDMMEQIDQYYKGQMQMFEQMASSIKSASEMASSLAGTIGEISTGAGGSGGASGGGAAAGGGMPS